MIWSLIFGAAGIFNMMTSFRTPNVYVEFYGPSAVLSFYKSFIYGIFSDHTTLFVALIASGQILVAVLLLMRKRLFQLGIIGGIIFLMAISPLGVGSAFPATLFMAASLIVLHKKIQYGETV